MTESNVIQEDNLDWATKYRPQNFSDIQGNTKAVKAIKNWVEGFEPGDSPQLLVGEPGTGKTSTAYVAAEQTGLDFNEIDASTARTTDDVERFSGEMRAGEQLVLVDEVDSWHHAVDLEPLRRELQDPQNPVILTANIEYDVPQAIKGPAETHEFKLNVDSRRARIKEIAKREGVPLDEKDLERLVDRPDLRSAINDLQLHAEMGVPVDEDRRQWDGSDFEAMDQIIQQGDTSDVDMRPPWLVMWLDQNVRKEYQGFEAAAAYDALSRADTYLGNVEGGDYHGWRFAGLIAELIPELSLGERYQGWIRWEFPSWVQSTVPKHEDDDAEAKLYRELDVSGGYIEFRETVLPILRRLPERERVQLLVNRGVGVEAASALDVSEAAYDDATVYSEAVPGEELDPKNSALEGEW